VKPKDVGLARQLESGLKRFAERIHPLPGIHSTASRYALIEQFLESIHRVKYVSVISQRGICPLRGDPTSDLFDPLKAAILRQRKNQFDEAFWLIFYFVHFGKNARTSWRLARDIYGQLGAPRYWDWAAINADIDGFREWLKTNQRTLKANGHFGNHRKYQSLDAYSASGTGTAFKSYVEWIKPFGTHQRLVKTAEREVGNSPHKLFDYIYHSMNAVTSFGRMAKFDYLTMIGKMSLAPIAPGSAYLDGATGPVSGTRLLFGDKTSSLSALDQWLIMLGSELHVGMQVVEDALCNWQKSPERFMPFRG
jgi:Alpha-glutamyl/putrescinyl thymine pyrophosphorylase clade 3